MKTAKVYMWRCDNVADELYEQMYKSVSPQRREKADRLKQKSDKILSLAAETLLSLALKKEGIDEFEITVDKNGKPYLKACDDIFFNLSHSENMVMCAVSDSEIGCDIEKIKEPKIDVAKRFFSPKEFEYIDKKLSYEEKADAFYRIWTLKESYIKAKGEGMKIPLYSFEVISGENALTPDSDFKFSEFCISGYRCAVCHMTDEVEWKVVDI